MKVELTEKSDEQYTQDVFTVTLKRHELERLHLILLSARANGTQEMSAAITAAMTRAR